MDIVKSNFKEHIESILEDIRGCDFMSCDGEFTGIRNESFKAMPFDTVAQRYEKMKQGNMGYLMCQVGISMFFQKDDGSYTVKPYNFYVLPQNKFSDQTIDTSLQFVCQASCINFLASHGFDFNKVFREGIPYLRPADESKVKDKLMEREEEKKNRTSMSVKPEDEKFISGIITRVEKYIEKVGSNDAKPLDLEPCHAFRRKLIYERIESRFGDTLHLQAAGTGKRRYIQITKVDAEQRKAKEKEIFDKKLAELSDAVGFSRVVREISESGKVVVGHNMLLDVMYLISQFLAQLPDSYDEFKVMTSQLFPKLLDTKVMSSTYLFKDNIEFNSLEGMDKVLQSSLYKPVGIEIADGFPDYMHADSNVQFHDAAYDSFITGRCFAVMSQHIGQKADPPVHNLASHSKLLTPFINKLFVNGIQDIPYMNLSGADVKVDREHMYHLTFPNTWTRNDINQVFFPALIYVKWIDATSVMVTLQQRSDNDAVKKLLSSTTHGCTILSYKEWQQETFSQVVPGSVPTDTGTQQHQQQQPVRAEKRKQRSGDICERKKAAKSKPVLSGTDLELSAMELDTCQDSAGEPYNKTDKLFAEENSW